MAHNIKNFEVKLANSVARDYSEYMDDMLKPLFTRHVCKHYGLSEDVLVFTGVPIEWGIKAQVYMDLKYGSHEFYNWKQHIYGLIQANPAYIEIYATGYSQSPILVLERFENEWILDTCFLDCWFTSLLVPTEIEFAVLEAKSFVRETIVERVCEYEYSYAVSKTVVYDVGYKSKINGKDCITVKHYDDDVWYDYTEDESVQTRPIIKKFASRLDRFANIVSALGHTKSGKFLAEQLLYKYVRNQSYGFRMALYSKYAVFLELRSKIEKMVDAAESAKSVNVTLQKGQRRERRLTDPEVIKVASAITQFSQNLDGVKATFAKFNQTEGHSWDENIRVVEGLELVDLEKDDVTLLDIQRNKLSYMIEEANEAIDVAKLNLDMPTNVVLFANSDGSCSFRISDDIKPEMDPGIEEDVETANVNVLSARPTGVVEPIPIKSDYFSKASATSVTQTPENYDSMVGRFLFIKSYEWNEAGPKNTVIAEISPLEDILDYKNVKTPNAYPFKIFNYFHGDIEFMFLVNANKMQVGKLQASFYYGDYQDRHFTDLRRNVHTASQRVSKEIDASRNNVVRMTIPFKSPYVNFPLRANTVHNDAKKYGRLLLLVQNPLMTPDVTEKRCSVSVLMRFTNCTFTGMVPEIGSYRNSNYDDSQAEMDTALAVTGGAKSIINGVESLLNVISPDKNRDKPIMDHMPLPVIPTASHSLAAGKNTYERIQGLRIDPTAQTPHKGFPDDEMDILKVCQTEMLVKIVTWSKSDLSGSLLFRCDATPYYSDAETFSKDGSKCQNQPPVAIVSSMFANWRGSLRLSLDIVCSQFHAGRLLVAYVPGVDSNYQLSLSEARKATHSIIDIEDGKKYVIDIPWISSKTYWRRKEGLENDDQNDYPPGVVYCMVLNPLVVSSAIPPKVYINVKWSAGSDFELAVPIASNFGLAFNAYISDREVTTSIIPKSGYTPIYCGSYHGFGDSKYYTLRHATTSGAIVEFQNLSQFGVYKVPNRITYKDEIYDYRIEINISMTRAQNLVYVVPYNGDTNQYSGVLCAKSLGGAKDYVKNGRYKDVRQNYNIFPYFKGSAWSQSRKVGTTTWTSAPDDMIPIFERVWHADVGVSDETGSVEESNDSEYFVLDAGPEMDMGKTDAEVPISMSKMEFNRTSGVNMIAFGETVNDLKDVLRRYNRYCMKKLTTYNNITDVSSYSLLLPVLPQGLSLDLNNVSSYDMVTREGNIGIIASAYRFFRGSVRFKLIVHGVSDTDIITIQYRPDYPFFKDSCTVNDDIVAFGFEAFDPGYPTIIQSCKVNNVVEFEVPYNMPSQYGYLQRPSHQLKNGVSSELTSMGAVFVYINGNKKKEVEVEVYYAMGDDMRFYDFVGFPAIFNKFNVDKVTSMLDDDSKAEMFSVNVPGLESCTDEFKTLIPDIRESFKAIKDVTKDMKGLKKDISFTSSKITSDFNSLCSGLLGSTNLGMTSIESIAKVNGQSTKIVLSISQQILIEISHALISPTRGTILLSCCVIAKLILYDTCKLVLSATSLEIMFNKLKVGFEKMLSWFREHNATEDEFHDARAEMSESLVNDGINLCFKTISVAFGLGFAKSYGKGITDFMANFGRFSSSMDSLFEYFKQFINFIGDLFSEVISGSDSSVMMLEKFDSGEISSWAGDCETMLSMPYSEVSSNMAYVAKSYQIHTYGLELVKSLSITNVSAKPFPYILRLLEKIERLTLKLSEDKIYSPVAYDPFVLYMAGPANMGKSFYLYDLLIRLAESKDIKASCGEMVYTKSAGSKHWNGLFGQPIALFDDFAAVETQDSTEIQDLFSLKSCASFNPPMASVEDKKIRYNPFIVGIASNVAFPKSTTVAVEAALWRRRDVLVEVAIDTDVCKATTDHIPAFLADNPEIAKNYGHLKFRVIISPSKPILDTNSTPWIKKDEFETFLFAKYSKYFEIEKVKYNKRFEYYEKNVTGSFTDFARKMKYESNNLETSDGLGLSTSFSKGLYKAMNVFTHSNPTVVLNKNTNIEEYNLIKVGDMLKKYEEDTKPESGVDLYDGKDDEFHKFCEMGKCLHTSYDCCGLFYIGGNRVFTPDNKALSLEPCRSFVHDAYTIYAGCAMLDPQKYYKGWLEANRSTFELSKKYEDIKMQIPPDVFAFVEADYKSHETITYDDGLTTTLPNGLKVWHDNLSDPAKLSLKILGVLSSVLVIVGIGTLIYKVSKSDPDCEAEYSKGSKPRSHAPSRRWVSTKTGSKLPGRSVGNFGNLGNVCETVDVDFDETMESPSFLAFLSKIERNTYFMTHGAHTMRVLCVGGRNAIMPYHYYESILRSNETIVYLTSITGVRLEFNIENFSFTRVVGTQLVMATFPKQFPLSKDMDSYFVNGDIPIWDKVLMVETCVTEGVDSGTTLNMLDKINSIENYEVGPSSACSGWTIIKGYAYSGFRGYGCCGSLLVGLYKGRYTIFGMHTAGSESRSVGYAEPLDFDMIHSIEENSEVNFKGLPEGFIEAGDSNFTLTSNILHEGKSEKVVRLSEKTKYEPSLIQGVYPVKTQPGPLSSKDVRDIYEGSPLFHGCNKHGNPPKEFDKNKLSMVMECMSNNINVHCKPTTVCESKISMSDSIDGNQIFKGLDMSTSPGFPWVLDRGRGEVGKSFLFTRHLEEKGFVTDEICPKLESAITESNINREKGIVNPVIYADCLKDYRIPIEKYSVPGKTRVFGMSPVDASICHKMYLQSFLSAYIFNNFECENTIGINPDGFEWARLYSLITKRGGKIIAGDYSSYGPTLSSQVSKAIFENVINPWYKKYCIDCTDEHQIARKAISDEIFSAFHLANDCLYRVVCGLPSGCIFTTEMNSMVNSAYIRLAWLDIMEDSKFRGLDSFEKFVSLFSNGDDLIAWVSDEVIETFNNKSLSIFFAKHSIKYTSPSKSDDVSVFESIETVEFLKRGFILNPVDNLRVMAPVALDSVRETANWIKKNGESNIVNTLQNIDQSCRLCYGHGPKVYSEHRDRLIEAMKLANIYTQLPTWEDLDYSHSLGIGVGVTYWDSV